MRATAVGVSVFLLVHPGAGSIALSDEFGEAPADHLRLANSIKYEATAVALASVVFGSLSLHDLEGSFKFTNEGWFGNSTKYAGVDKLGHAWYGAAVSDLLYERMRAKNGDSRSAALTAAGLSFAIMTLIEVGDGFAANATGFSWEDLVADAAGAAFSFIRNTNPEIRDVVDFRLEYLPDISLEDWNTGTFYSDQKYLLAWKLSGLKAFQSSPLRFLEVHTGYHTRGFSSLERKRGVRKERNLYVGLGLNLSEMLFRNRHGNSRLDGASRWVLEHVQVPYTYVGASSFD
ncbi:MAG: YfiM family protein [Hyphomicrobiales bacterium]|nr:YfiM family protein [Hyphomicrobiales bacterium]